MTRAVLFYDLNEGVFRWRTRDGWRSQTFLTAEDALRTLAEGEVTWEREPGNTPDAYWFDRVVSVLPRQK